MIWALLAKVLLREPPVVQGDGGFKVASLAIVPLVLVAPTALHAFGLVVRRTPK
jgi:hypothetical protein